MIKVSDFVIKFLEGQGVTHAFMLPGGGCMHLVDSLGRSEQIKYTCNLHEQASAIGAEAYGQYTNTLGVALVTTGPGSTNTLTGIAGGWIDSTPMLVLSGQAKTTDMLTGRGVRQMGIQEVDIVSMVSPITKYAVTVVDPTMIKYHLKKAVHEATSGRKGPVWLDIPLDVQGAMVDEDELADFYAPEFTADAEIEGEVEAILSILRNSKRPAVMAGNGLRLANVLDESMQLFEQLGIPVMTTWKTTDLLEEDHPLYCGRPGIVGQRGANFVQQTADCLLIFGTRLDLCQTGFNHPNFAPNAKKIIIDIDACEIGKLDMEFELILEADLGPVIKEMLNQSPVKLDCESWLKHCRELYAKYPVILPEYIGNDGPVNTYHFIEALSQVMEPTDVLIPGSSGACAEVTQQAIKVKKGLRVLNTPGLGAMGFGLPATIGAAVASGKRTIGIVGDGGIQMNIQELQTLKHHKLPVKIFVLNNGGYGSIFGMQKNRFDGNYVACNAESGLTLPDICKLAETYGLNTMRIETQENLAEKVAKALQMDGPVICDIIVDQSCGTSPRLASEVKEDGTIVSKPMEDLFPFLDRDEFNAIMNY